MNTIWQPGAPTRILVAEDFQAFRHFIRWLLQEKPELQIVCEVSDGLEAVQKAEELQPDLISARHRSTKVKLTRSR